MTTSSCRTGTPTRSSGCELRDVTGHGVQTVDTALDHFFQRGIIETRREGTRKRISIDRDRIQMPGDPILAIPQGSFRTAVKAFRDVLLEQQDNVMAESVNSAEQYGAKLQTIFSEGITLYETERLADIRRGVLHGGERD